MKYTVRNILDYLLIFILLFVSILSAILFYKTKYQLINENDNLKYSYNQLIQKYQLEKKFQNIQIPMNILLIDIYGDTISMTEILNENVKYIFRYTEFNCQSCVDKEILRLKEMKIPTNELVVISYYNSLRSLIYFIKETGFDFPIYSAIDNMFIADLDNLNLPYYIKLSKDNIVKDVFLVNRDEGLIENYFYNIEK